MSYFYSLFSSRSILCFVTSTIINRSTFFAGVESPPTFFTPTFFSLQYFFAIFGKLRARRLISLLHFERRVVLCVELVYEFNLQSFEAAEKREIYINIINIYIWIIL